MSGGVNIALHHLTLVKEILLRHLPPGVEVSVFGSRANGRARRGSDLDLLLNGGEKLPASLIGSLKDDFEESDLPYTVDVLDEHDMAPTFRPYIHPVPFPW